MFFLSKIDIFKQTVSFNLKNENHTSSLTGKIITFLMIFYTLNKFFQSDLFFKTNPRVTVDKNRPLMRPNIFLNNSNFTFAVGLYDLSLGYVSDPTIFSYTAAMMTWDNFNNDYFESKIELEKCTEENFKSAGENFKGTIQKNLFCLNLKNQTVNLFGAYNERMVKFLFLELNQCRNSSINNFSCKPIDIQKQFLQGCYQDFIFQNDVIDYGNLKFPIKKDITKFYVTVDSGFSKIVTGYVKHVAVKSDQGFFSQDIEQVDSNIVEEVFYDFQSSDLNSSNKPLVRLELYSDGQEVFHNRRYQHVQDLLAEMGGILNIFLILGFLIIQLELQYLFTKKISSELYAYKLNDPTVKKKTSERYKKNENHLTFERKNFSFDGTFSMNESKKEKEKEGITMSLNGSKQKIHCFSSPEEKELEKRLNPNLKPIYETKNYDYNESLSKTEITEEKKGGFLSFASSLTSRFITINSNIEKGNNFPINFLTYLWILFKCRRFKLNLKEKLFLLGEKQVKKDLDVFKIINSMNDVERLKMILLNDKQRYLFNVLQKPIITLKTFEADTPTNSLIYSGIQNKIKKNLVKEYYNDLIKTRENSEIDRKILDLIDKDFLNFYQNSQTYGSKNKIFALNK